MKQKRKVAINDLPENINEIINASLKTIDINALIAWLKSKKILIRFRNQGGYKLSSNEEIKCMIADTIKQYYNDNPVEDSYMYGQNIDNNVRPYIGGISLRKCNWYFKIDFDLIQINKELGRLESTSFLKEAIRLTQLN